MKIKARARGEMPSCSRRRDLSALLNRWESKRARSQPTPKPGTLSTIPRPTRRSRRTPSSSLSTQAVDIRAAENDSASPASRDRHVVATVACSPWNVAIHRGLPGDIPSDATAAARAAVAKCACTMSGRHPATRRRSRPAARTRPESPPARSRGIASRSTPAGHSLCSCPARLGPQATATAPPMSRQRSATPRRNVRKLVPLGSTSSSLLPATRLMRAPPSAGTARSHTASKGPPCRPTSDAPRPGCRRFAVRRRTSAVNRP